MGALLMLLPVLHELRTAVPGLPLGRGRRVRKGGYSSVYVAHPTLAAPRDVDFGERPRLLRALLSRGLVTALRVSHSVWNVSQETEQTALRDLQSAEGLSSVMRFVAQAQLCDEASVRAHSLSERMRAF